MSTVSLTRLDRPTQRQAYHQVGGKLGHAEGYSEEEGKAQGGKGKEKTPRQTAKAKAAQEEAEAEVRVEWLGCSVGLAVCQF